LPRKFISAPACHRKLTCAFWHPHHKARNQNSEVPYSQSNMKCPECQQKTRVTDTRQLMSKNAQPFTWRRLKCENEHISYTHEVFESTSPIKEKVRYIIRQGELKGSGTAKKKVRKKKALPVEEIVVVKAGINIKKSSPEWLKKIALQLE